MELKEVILRQHSKDQAIAISNYIGEDAIRFSELVSLFLGGPYRVTQRAALPLNLCVERNAKLIRPHLKEILQRLEQPLAPGVLKRNAVRLFQFITIPKSLHGQVAKICFRFFQNKKEAIAVRVFAMTVLANLAKELPELKNELIPLVEDEMPYGSAGFISRGRKVLKELKS